MWYDVLLDAFIDTLKLVPFLFLMYVLIELMEHNTKMGRPSRLLTGKAAPLIGSATGLVPMCGFSVMAAKLYEHRHVTLGALLAVFAATSDEAAIVLVDEAIGLYAAGKAGGGGLLISLAALLGCQFVLGVGIGYAADLIFRRRFALAPLPEHHAHEHEHVHGHEEENEGHVEHEEHEGHEAEHEARGVLEEHEHGHEEHEHEGHEDHEHGECACDELSVCEHKHPSAVRMYLVSPLLHMLQVAAFVLLVNLAFGFLFFGVGEARVVGFLQGAGYWFQPLVCPLVGLVPNCASSVILAEVYSLGGIGFGGLLGGLVANAGLGYLVLFGKGKSALRAVCILLAMYLFGVAVGYAASGIALLIPL